MSWTSWMKEFYPKKATSRSIKTDLEAVEHSIQKWKGLISKNVQKHGLTRISYTLRGDGGKRLDADSDTCALCQRASQHDMKRDEFSMCDYCPITQITGKNCLQTYLKADRKPYLMVRLLEKVKAALLKQQAE